MFSPECQQLIVNEGGLRSAHKLVKERSGRTPLSQIKLMKDDAAGVERESENIKKRYTQIFKV
jgi:iron(III) transport system substrate-binding protein